MWLARRVGESAFSFVSFSLGLHRQRKAVKEAWYLKIVPQNLTTDYFLSTFSLGQEPQRKSSQKETAGAPTRRGATTRGEVAFEKATQNDTRSACEHIDKSQFIEIT